MNYIDLGPYPLIVSFTNNEKEFLKEMRRLKIEEYDTFLSENAKACVHFFKNIKTNLPYLIACFDSKIPKKNLPGVIAHEAWHIVEKTHEYMGETKAGSEATAYLIQYLVEVMYNKLTERVKRK